MSYFERLNQILTQTPRLEINSNGEYWLKETDGDNKYSLKKVVLEGLEEKATIGFKFDHYKEVSPYFDKSCEFIHKGADAVFLTQIDDIYYLFICELKSKTFRRKNDVEKKFINTKLFVDYIHSICVNLFGVTVSLAEIEIRYLLFHLKKGQKQKVGRSKNYEVNYETSKYPDLEEGVYEIYKSTPKHFSFNVNELITL